MRQLPPSLSSIKDQPLYIRAYKVPTVGGQIGYIEQGVNIYNDPFDAYKEVKIEDYIWSEMLEAALNWI